MVVYGQHDVTEVPEEPKDYVEQFEKSAEMNLDAENFAVGMMVGLFAVTVVVEIVVEDRNLVEGPA